MKTITVATDGSALHNPTGPAGWAWYVDKDSWACGGFEQASNNYAELCAVMAALKQIPSKYPLRILTDSQYITKMFGDDGHGGYAAGWRKKGWKKKDGNPPANLAVVRTIYSLIERRENGIKLVWVKGHNGHDLNTKADALCTKMSALVKNKKRTPPSPGWNPMSAAEPQKAQRGDDDGVPRRVRRGNKPSPKKEYVQGSPKPRLRKGENYASLFGDEEEDEAADRLYNERRERERKKELVMQGKTVLCDSCGTPISPLTFECMCSF